jgi:glycosyltransferase involved in cell wall biosynthesis
MHESSENRILLVGPYPPRRCGIATHISQLATTLAAEGYQVDVLSPPDCAGSLHANLRGGINVLKLLKYAKKYDRINIHFEFAEFFYLGHGPLRALNIFPLLAFWVLFRRLSNLNVVMHEPPPAKYFFQRTALQGFIWSRVPKITFFTKKELSAFERRYGIQFSRDQCLVENVSTAYQKYSNSTKSDARNRLRVDSRKITFLCVGFIHKNKGFDRVVQIFRTRNLKNSQLYIVGSVRLDEDAESREHLAALTDACGNCADAHLVNRYLTDEELDEWIVGSDYVVVPYRSISNSGILGRAKTYGKRAIVSNVGGLAEQIDDQDFLFSNDIELATLIGKIDADAGAADSRNP